MVVLTAVARYFDKDLHANNFENMFENWLRKIYSHIFVNPGWTITWNFEKIYYRYAKCDIRMYDVRSLCLPNMKIVLHCIYCIVIFVLSFHSGTFGRNIMPNRRGCLATVIECITSEDKIYLRQLRNIWWRHKMEKEIPRNLPFVWEIDRPMVNYPAQRPMTWSFAVLFDLRLNKRLCKQSWGWWFETPSPRLWGHCNDRLPLLWWLNALGAMPVYLTGYLHTNFNLAAIRHGHKHAFP